MDAAYMRVFQPLFSLFSSLHTHTHARKISSSPHLCASCRSRSRLARWLPRHSFVHSHTLHLAASLCLWTNRTWNIMTMGTSEEQQGKKKLLNRNEVKWFCSSDTFRQLNAWRHKYKIESNWMHRTDSSGFRTHEKHKPQLMELVSVRNGKRNHSFVLCHASKWNGTDDTRWRLSYRTKWHQRIIRLSPDDCNVVASIAIWCVSQCLRAENEKN